MLLLVLFFIISLLPSLFLYLWLKKRKRNDFNYQQICANTFKRGLFLSPLSALGIGVCFYVIEIVFKLVNLSDISLDIYHTFIVVALSEELAKFLTFKSAIKKNSYTYSLLDLLSLLIIVGLSFQILEACVYAIGADIPTMMMRGLTIMHASFQFVMAYFYIRSIKTNKKGYFLFGFVLVWLMHGVYDFCLHEIASRINENLIYVSLAIAFICFVLNIVQIFYINKVKRLSEDNVTKSK